MTELTWKGRPVPWVARWTNEVSMDMFKVVVDSDSHLQLTFEDGKVNRDEHGVLWQREGITRGGEPQFSQVSTYRQKAAMRKMLCQVCGTKLPGGPVRWLFHKDNLIESSDGLLTMSPPTCEPCIDKARTHCPALKAAGSKILVVTDWEIWGIFGGAVLMTKNGLDRKSQIYVSYEQELPKHVALCAQQQVVRLLDYKEEVS